MSHNTMQLSLPSDREIEIRRDFNAPRDHVIKLFTVPELIKRWNYGPDNWRAKVCELDLKVGGKIRYVWAHASGASMGMSGSFIEIALPDYMVHKELFDEDWTGGETRVTVTLKDLSDKDGGVKSAVILTTVYQSKAARDTARGFNMEEGMALGFDRLESVLASL